MEYYDIEQDPKKEELEKIMNKSYVEQLQNIYDHAMGKAQGIERDAVKAIILTSLKEITKLRSEIAQLKAELVKHNKTT